MQPALQKYDIGVLVGRFQVHELHDAHRDLIQYVCDRHDKVVIFLGLSPLSNSTGNPLDFESRKQMILAEFPHVNVLYIKDVNSDEVWSKKLDEQINDVGTPGQSCVIYGGRDSFIAHYKGQFPTQELMQETFTSGTEVRKSIARSRTRSNAAFRAGVIWASQARFPTAYTTVDVAILKTDHNDSKQASESWKACRLCQPRTACDLHRAEAAAYFAEPRATQLLLAKKPNESLYRFVGGFSDPKSESFESDAKREVTEETTLEVGNPRYVGSTLINDWRYQKEPDGIKTMLFTAQYLHGRPTPSDDLAGGELRWFNLSDHASLTGQVMPEHRPLMVMLLNHINRKES